MLDLRFYYIALENGSLNLRRYKHACIIIIVHIVTNEIRGLDSSDVYCVFSFYGCCFPFLVENCKQLHVWYGHGNKNTKSNVSI